MTTQYTAGFQAAYEEIHLALSRCPRPHGIIDVLMDTLAGKLTQEEFFGLAIRLADLRMPSCSLPKRRIL